MLRSTINTYPGTGPPDGRGRSSNRPAGLFGTETACRRTRERPRASFVVAGCLIARRRFAAPGRTERERRAAAAATDLRDGGGGRPMRPVVSGRQENDRHDHAGDQGRGDANRRSHLPSEAATKSARASRGDLEDVREHVDAHRAEPDDEARFVEADDIRAADAGRSSGDARCRTAPRRSDRQRRDEEPQERSAAGPARRTPRLGGSTA